MTRKDYELIAGVLKNYLRIDYGVQCVLEELAEEFADVLATTNPLFNREKFLIACGVN
jgi:hypothetical protein